MPSSKLTVVSHLLEVKLILFHYQFDITGGVRVVCTNLVVSNRAVIDTSPSTVSAIMQHLGSMSKLSSGSSSGGNRSNRLDRTVAGASADVENVDGLVNFAPYGKKG